MIQTPVETAIHHYDPVIFLLAGLGASLDIGTKQSYERPWSGKASLLESVEEIIKNLSKELESSKQPVGPESMDLEDANRPEWKAWITKSYKATKDFEKKVNKRRQNNESINKHTRMKDYLEEVLGLLKEKKAKTWNQLHPDDKRKEEDHNNQQKQAIFFDVWTSDWRTESVPREKVPLYEELYEACWNGDDDKIRELCLPPPKGATRKVAPIQIVCRTNEESEPCFSPVFVLFDADATVHRVHPAACCDPSSSLVDGEYCPDDRRRSTEGKARGYHHGGFQYV